MEGVKSNAVEEQKVPVESQGTAKRKFAMDERIVEAGAAEEAYYEEGEYHETRTYRRRGSRRGAGPGRYRRATGDRNPHEYKKKIGNLRSLVPQEEHDLKNCAPDINIGTTFCSHNP